MKNLAFIILVFSLLTLGCKREIMEPVVEKEKDDITITNPEYWCVKGISKNGYHNYKFDYDANSNLVKTKYYVTVPYKQDTAVTTYEYQGKHPVIIKRFRGNTQIYSESRIYKDGKIESVTVTEYEEPAVTSYEYSGSTVKTLSLGRRFPNADTISKTLCSVYADSIVGDIKFYWNDSLKPIYTYRETLIKSSKIIIMDFRSLYISTPRRDTVYLSDHVNLIHPEIWSMLNFYEPFYSYYPYYEMRSVALRRENNPYFIDKISPTTHNKYNYTFDEKGRVTKIAEEINTSDSDSGPMQGSNLEPRLATNISFYY